MIEIENSLKITAFHKKPINSFIKNLKILCDNKLYKNLLIYKGFNIIKKKNTILTSPHVHKKARDQIEIQNISYFFEVKNKFNWLFFFINLKNSNNIPFKFDFKYNYFQIIYIKDK